MRIVQLEINHYKSIHQPFVLRELGNLHIFIGSNNAGKTNILDALSQLYQENDVRLLDPATDLYFKFRLKSKFGRELAVRQKGQEKVFTLDSRQIGRTEAEKILNHHVIRLCAANPCNLNQLQTVYEQFYRDYLDLFKIFHDTLLKYFPEINTTKDFLETKSIQEFGKVRPFERLGAGLQQVFIMLLYLFHPQYTILLLEEPEIHLHPALIKKLLNVFEKENLDNQLFLTTHSPLFIHPANLHRLFRVVREQETTRVYSPRLTGRQIDYSRLTQELNADNCEMFFADTVLLVEGPSDHILMRGLIDRFYEGRKEIKVIQVYGKSNIDVYVELLEMFNLQYVVMLDEDAVQDTGLQLVQGLIKNGDVEPDSNLISFLKEHRIYILPNGSIERNYPAHYQKRHRHKPFNAFYAASRITRDEYHSPLMRNIREVIDSL